MAKYQHVGTLPLTLDAGRDKDGFQIDQHVAVGETFEATLSPEQEAFLIKSRAIVRVAE
jgi:hypothetical protein